MSIFERLQHSIIEGDYQLAERDVKSGGNLTPKQRIEIYIHAYVARLMQVVRSDFAATLSLLPLKEADLLLEAYVHAHPSTYFNLDKYPHHFADFMAERSDNHFACEVAKLENAIAVVFNAPDSAVMPASLLQSLTPEAFAAMQIHPRAASTTLVFSYPVQEWFMNVREGATPALPSPHIQYMYLYRHNNQVMREVLSPSGYYLLTALIRGNTVEEAIIEVITQYPELQEEIIFNLQNWIGSWIAKGMFANTK